MPDPLNARAFVDLAATFILALLADALRRIKPMANAGEFHAFWLDGNRRGFIDLF